MSDRTASRLDGLDRHAMMANVDDIHSDTSSRNILVHIAEEAHFYQGDFS